jgi:hypothetical protein
MPYDLMPNLQLFLIFTYKKVNAPQVLTHDELAFIFYGEASLTFIIGFWELLQSVSAYISNYVYYIRKYFCESHKIKDKIYC